MASHALSFSLLLLLVVAAARAPMRVLLVNYHKTGAAFVLSLMRVLTSHAPLHVRLAAHVPQPFRQRCTSQPVGALAECTADLVRWSSPELVCVPPFPACYAHVVHFVRDPTRWAISAYDFHRQTPPAEEWAARRGNNLCAPSERRVYAGVLSEAEVAAAAGACEALAPPNASLHEILNALPEADSIPSSSICIITAERDAPCLARGRGRVLRRAHMHP